MHNHSCTVSDELSSSNLFATGLSVRLAGNTIGGIGNLAFVGLLATMSTLDRTVKCTLVNLNLAIALHALNGGVSNALGLIQVFTEKPCGFETLTHDCIIRESLTLFITLGMVNIIMCASVERAWETHKLRIAMVKNAVLPVTSAAFNMLIMALPWALTFAIVAPLIYVSYMIRTDDEKFHFCIATYALTQSMSDLLFLYYIISLILPIILFKYAEKQNRRMRQRFVDVKYQQSLALRVALKRNVQTNKSMYMVAVYQVSQWVLTIIMTVVCKSVFAQDSSVFYIALICIAYLISSCLAQAQPIVCMFTHNAIRRRFMAVCWRKSNRIEPSARSHLDSTADDLIQSQKQSDEYFKQLNDMFAVKTKKMKKK